MLGRHSRYRLPMSTLADTTPGTQEQPLRAGIYGRASQDRSKRGRSVRDQIADCRRECSTRGWTVVDEYIDLDRSASRHARKVREDYTRLVADIQAGKLDMLVSWESSRVSRDLDVYVKLRNLCTDTGVLWCYNGTIYDMRKGADRTTTAIMAMMAEAEADSMQERSARTTRLSAGRGTPHGRIPFGYARRYDPDDGHLLGQVPHPVHADVVLDLFQRAADRETVRSLTATLCQHVPRASTRGLTYLLQNRTYIGLRSHFGQHVKATWEPIVPEALFWRVQEIIVNPERRTSRDTRALHLLSGIAMCGVCKENTPPDQPLPGLRLVRPVAQPRRVSRYCCKPGSHVATGAERLEAYVEEHLMVWLKSPEAATAFASRDDGALEEARGRAARIRVQLQEARAMAAEFDDTTGMPLLSIASLADMERRLAPMAARAEEDLRRLAAVGDPVLDQLLADPERAEAVWERLGMEKRRHAVRNLVNVTLHKAAAQGIRSLDESRVTLTFVSQPGFTSRPTIRRPPVEG